MINQGIKLTQAPASFTAMTASQGPYDAATPTQDATDEMVWDDRTGTFTWFQGPPDLAKLLQSGGGGACSFVI